MSNRHQSSRRKAYGRRQHEVHERALRRPDLEPLDTRIDRFGTAGDIEPFGLFDGETLGARFQFVLAD